MKRISLIASRIVIKKRKKNERISLPIDKIKYYNWFLISKLIVKQKSLPLGWTFGWGYLIIVKTKRNNRRGGEQKHQHTIVFHLNFVGKLWTATTTTFLSGWFFFSLKHKKWSRLSRICKDRVRNSILWAETTEALKSVSVLFLWFPNETLFYTCGHMR